MDAKIEKERKEKTREKKIEKRKQKRRTEDRHEMDRKKERSESVQYSNIRNVKTKTQNSKPKTYMAVRSGSESHIRYDGARFVCHSLAAVTHGVSTPTHARTRI